MHDGIRVQAERLFYEGNQHLNDRDYQRAEGCFQKAVDLLPGFSEALTNLGFVLDARGDLPAAESVYRRAWSAGADSLEFHLNFGSLLTTLKRFEDAQCLYAKALQCQPESSAIWSNLGVLMLGLKNDDDAQTCLDKAIELDPGNSKALFNLAYLHLRHARFDTGWKYLEARDWYKPLARHFACPRWSGESLVNQSLIICYEAGHGDVIQFCRYIPLIKTQGSLRILLVCHPALKTLMQTLDGLTTVIGFDERLPDLAWDYWTPLFSIAYHLKTRADSIPASIPYLKADAELKQRWATQLPTGVVRVGLVWKGNPSFENDAERSLASIRTLKALWNVGAVSFVSLQKGCGEAEVVTFSQEQPMIDLGSRMQDFADAAAIVSNLDLVICVDTAIAHLTGALGKPCWVMLPHFMTDWRWLNEGVESAWYPGTMRLFRQAQRGDWSLVIDEMAEALTVMALRLRQKPGSEGILPSCVEGGTPSLPEVSLVWYQ